MSDRTRGTARDRPESPVGGLRPLLGYLNFSSGVRDAAAFRAANDLFVTQRPAGWDAIRAALAAGLEGVAGTDPAFADVAQARSVIDVTFDATLPTYRRFHRDLLGHLGPAEDLNPYFLVELLAATLRAGGPWDEADRIAETAVASLNDFVGYRPVATLENGRRSSVYPHERHRPLPLYVRDAGVAIGPWHELVTATLDRLGRLPGDLLFASQFDPHRLDELALDLRAYDHQHPVTKRTNYPFGEWDPDVIDADGFFRRFVIRRVIFAGLSEWIEEGPGNRRDRLHDAAAVLGGTILMAAAVSGAGPGAYDSGVSLLTLLPAIAARRDEYYDRLLADAGADAARLRDIAKRFGQPYGDIRQFLNLRLADRGASQVRGQHAAFQLARLGRKAAAESLADTIDATSARIETSVRLELAAGTRAVRTGDTDEAWRAVRAVRDLIDRGIDCGALADPWNALGFAGQFPLFTAREDSIPDHRLETLIELTGEGLHLAGDAIAAAAARGEAVPGRLEELREWADRWDGYAVGVVADLSELSGASVHRSAAAIAAILSAREGGEPDGDGLRFWRAHVDELPHADAYARVVETLLAEGRDDAAVGVLLHWLGRTDEVGVGDGRRSVFDLLRHAFETLLAREDADRPQRVTRFFRFLEANAEAFWEAPAALEILDPPPGEDETAGGDESLSEDDPDAVLFSAAYEGVSFRDSADDGREGDLLDGPGEAREGDSSDFDAERRGLGPRLRFLATVAELRIAAANADDAVEPDAAREWLAHGERPSSRLDALLGAVERPTVETFGDDSEANAVYDDAVQARTALLRELVKPAAEFRLAALLVGARLDTLGPDDGRERSGEVDRRLVAAVLDGDVVTIRHELAVAAEQFTRRPLLYANFEYGGKAADVVAARTSQRLLQLLVRRLPRLGLVGETLDTLRMALRMERASRVDGPAVTEFDRLFRVGLAESVEAVCRAHRSGPPVSRVRPAPDVAPLRDGDRPRRSDRGRSGRLLRDVAAVVDAFQEPWIDHGRTMRLSAAELLSDPRVWRRVRKFIRDYGGDLLHARVMTLSNLRAILARGVETFVVHLRDTEEAFDRGGSGRALAEALRDESLSTDRAEEALEPIFATVLDRLERYVEYNTTTTHSDYGDRLDRFLEFVRLEARYERDGWNLLPQTLAHRVLARHARPAEAAAWAAALARRTSETADRYLTELRDLEREHAMRLPSVTDHLDERFVRPVAIDRLLEDVPDDPLDGRDDAATRARFERLETAIAAQLDTPPGSSVDLPEWLRRLERRVDAVLDPRPHPGRTKPVFAPPARIRSQLRRRSERRG